MMKLKGKAKPKAVESFLNDKRLLNDFLEVVERKIVEDKVEEAKQKLKSGEKAIININPLLIHVPTWQRELDVNRAKRIASDYNPYKWELPKVMLHNKKLVIVDGEHRIIGAVFGGMKFVQVEVLIGVTEADAIELFLSQGDDRRRMSPQDTYSAALEAKKEEYVTLKRICNNNHVAVKGDQEPIKNPIGILTSISDGISLAKNNPDLLNRILSIIGKLQWNAGKSAHEGKAYTAKVIRVFKKLYAYYSGREIEMETVLLNNCKGSKYFNDNLVEKWQDSLFDYLSNVIEKNIDIPNVSAKSTPKTRRKKQHNTHQMINLYTHSAGVTACGMISKKAFKIKRRNQSCTKIFGDGV